MFRNITEIKKANKERGHHFFSKETIRFWGSIIYPNVYGGRYFITSEDNFNRTERLYSVRKARQDGSVDTVWESGEFNTFNQAKRAVEALVSDVRQEAGK